MASSGNVPDEKWEDFLVNLFKGPAIAAKFGIVLLKKLHRPKKLLIPVTSVGGCHAIMARVLATPGRIAFPGSISYPK